MEGENATRPGRIDLYTIREAGLGCYIETGFSMVFDIWEKNLISNDKKSKQKSHIPKTRSLFSMKTISHVFYMVANATLAIELLETRAFFRTKYLSNILNRCSKLYLVESEHV